MHLEAGGYMVCSAHFDDCMYNCPERRHLDSRLKHGACPKNTLVNISSQGHEILLNKVSIEYVYKCYLSHEYTVIHDL